MSASFRPKIKPSTRSGPAQGLFRPSGIAFQGAVLSGLVSAALAWAGGQYLIKTDYEAQAKEFGISLRAQASVLAKQLGPVLDQGEIHGALRILYQGLESTPGATAFVLDASGASLLTEGTTEETQTLAHLHPVAEGILVGRLGQAQYLEVRQEVRGPLLALGTLHLRQSLPAPVWAGGILPMAQWFSLLSALAAFLYLSFSVRGLGKLHRVLARAGAGDFYERAPVVGCFEMRQLIQKTHEVLEQVGEAQGDAQKVYVETAIALSKTIEAKDRYTSGHSQRVMVYSLELGKLLNFDEDRLETLRLGALLHDIGKVAVPDDVLLKPGALSKEEFQTMKRHPMAGDRILSAIPGLRDMADIARSHHEKWDGSGYPLGVSGDSIPLEGRICAIADAYDALVTKRSYKPAMPVAKALNIIEADAGTHFDPELAHLFVTMKRNGKGYKPLPRPAAVEAELLKGKPVQSPSSR